MLDTPGHREPFAPAATQSSHLLHWEAPWVMGSRPRWLQMHWVTLNFCFSLNKTFHPSPQPAWHLISDRVASDRRSERRCSQSPMFNFLFSQEKTASEYRSTADGDRISPSRGHFNTLEGLKTRPREFIARREDVGERRRFWNFEALRPWDPETLRGSLKGPLGCVRLWERQGPQETPKY